jgi:hypothetical protein
MECDVAPIYQRDPEPADDSRFEPGALRHLVPGNRGRLLDTRRTPVVVRAVALEPGMFEVEVGAFEDAGARWQLPFEHVGHFQFARGGATAAPAAVAEYERAVRRLDRTITVAADQRVGRATLRDLDAERSRTRAWLARRLPAGAIDMPGMVGRRAGDGRLFDLLEGLMDARGLAEVERRFSAGFVSNPGSGEVVKGHAIVLAEMGLVSYHGKIIRDPGALEGAWSRQRRRAHVLARLAFVQEMLAHAGLSTVTLYRGVALEGPHRTGRLGSFVSATFSRDVAESHFDGGAATVAAALYRQVVRTSRLFMTFLETCAMNRQFKEAEAVLLTRRRGTFF